MKVAVIGEAPSKFMKERNITLPLVLAGAELAKMGGIQWPGEWNEVVDAFNVLDEFPGRQEDGKGDKFPFPLATICADRLKVKLGARPLVVLLGRRVERAWGLQPQQWFRVIGSVAVAPHPSHVNRWWNSRLNRLEAEAFWQEVAREARRHQDVHRQDGQHPRPAAV